MRFREVLNRAVEQAKTTFLAASRRARKIRQGSEFSMQTLLPLVRSPIVPTSTYSWDLETICAARDAQMIGRFVSPARMAESMRTDDALFVAYQNRLAPQRCLGVKMRPAKVARGDAIASEGDALFGTNGIGVTTDTMSDINGCLANHGVAFGVNVWNPRPDGSRIDVEMRPWPIEFVWWNAVARTWMTRIDPYPNVNPGAFGFVPPEYRDQYGTLQPAHGNNLVPIIHGDGRWVVFQKHELLPFRQDAAILPASVVWAAHAFGKRDWRKGSAAHGNAKVVGELPKDVSLDENTPEVAMFLTLLEAIGSSDSPIGIKPFGSSIDYLTNNSSAWQVWKELILNEEKAAARIYLGTDGILGTTGGAPGIDIAQLFGVATTIVQGDLACLERCLLTGTIEPWAALNFGDSRCAPLRAYEIPDADADSARKSLSDRLEQFNTAIKGIQDNGFDIQQEMIHELAQRFDVPEPMKDVVADLNPEQLTSQHIPMLSEPESRFRIQAPISHQAEFLDELKKLANKVGGSVLAIPED